MTVLRNIEAKIESLFEGVFGRAFRTNVQPVELARKLVKEMEDHRVISVSRLYVPNEYTVYLSPQDREQFASYEESLLGELQDDLAAEGPDGDRRGPRGRGVRNRDADGAGQRAAAGAGRSAGSGYRAGRDDGLQAQATRHSGGLRPGARARAGDRDALMER